MYIVPAKTSYGIRGSIWTAFKLLKKSIPSGMYHYSFLTYFSTADKDKSIPRNDTSQAFDFLEFSLTGNTANTKKLPNE